MTCQERQDLIPLLALGTLEPQEAQEIRAHLACGCPACEGCLAQAGALLAMLPSVLPPTPAPAQAKAKLMQRVNASAKQNAPSPMPIQRSAGGWKIGPPLLGLAAGLLIAAGIFMVRLNSERTTAVAFRDQNRKLLQEAADKDLQIGQLKSDVLMMNNAVKTVSSPTVQMVKMNGAAAQPNAHAHLFVDREGLMLLFCGDKLKSPGDRKTYELWLVSGDKKIPAGTFTPDAKGEVAIITKIQPGIGPITATAVTDEPLGGVPQPTGNYQLLWHTE